MIEKVKNWLLAILSLAAAAFGAYMITDDDKKELEEAKKKIDEAGEDIEAEHYDDGDNAANKLDNVLSKLESKDK